MDAAVRLLTVVLAALALAGPASGQVLGREPALRALKDPTAAERERGVVGLARNGQMADAPALVAALRDPDESVRAAAEQALWIVWSRSGNAQVDKLFAQGLEEMNGGRFDEVIVATGFRGKTLGGLVGDRLMPRHLGNLRVTESPRYWV